MPILPLLSGALSAGAAILLSLLLPAAFREPFWATLLAFVAAIYLGYALVTGQGGFLAAQIVSVPAFLFLAVWGLGAQRPGLIAAGYLLHGTWDLLQHRHLVRSMVVPWWSSYCSIFDWVVAAFLWLYPTGPLT